MVVQAALVFHNGKIALLFSDNWDLVFPFNPFMMEADII